MKEGYIMGNIDKVITANNSKAEYVISADGISNIFTTDIINEYMQAEQGLFKDSKSVRLEHLIFDIYNCCKLEETLKAYKQARYNMTPKMVKGISILGGYFYTEKEITVPKIPAGCTCYTGFDKNKVLYETIPAKSYFALTYLEAVLFLSQPQYGMICGYKNTSNCARLILRWDMYTKGKTKFPLPYFSVTGEKLIEDMYAVYLKEETGYEFCTHFGLQYVLEEKFGYLLEDKRNKYERKTDALSILASKLQKDFSDEGSVESLVTKNVRNCLMLDDLLSKSDKSAK